MANTFPALAIFMGMNGSAQGIKGGQSFNEVCAQIALGQQRLGQWAAMLGKLSQQR